MDSEMDLVIDKIVDALHESRLYVNYMEQQKKVKDNNELKAKIDEIRDLNVKLQNVEDTNEAYREQEYLENRYSELCEDSRVYDFIEAEADFARMYRKIMKRVMEEIQII